MRWKAPDLASMLPQYAGFDVPPESNANFAFVLYGLEKVDDKAVYLLPNSVLSATVDKEKRIKRQLIELNWLKAVIKLPPNMFESTSIPTCLLVFDKHKQTREIAMMDIAEECKEETREQRGQFGSKSHTARTYKKTVMAIPQETIDTVVGLIDNHENKDGMCTWVPPELIAENGYELTPGRYIHIAPVEIKHRPYEDIAEDYNRIIRAKNAIKIRMNKTAAARLGFDCFDVDRPDVSPSFAVAGQKVEKENFITFNASDGIDIKISTKEGIHPLILDFLNHWKQMIYYLNEEENRLLAEFRDALLPDLMSGKINVSVLDDAKDES